MNTPDKNLQKIEKLLNLDANASFGLIPEAMEVLTNFERLNLGLNPSSIHFGGQRAKALIEEARNELLMILKGKLDYRLIFTSGATESNSLALYQALEVNKNDSQRNEIILGSTEHPSVIEHKAFFEQRGFIVHILKLNNQKNYSSEDLLKLCNKNTCLISIMMANNETGHIYPVVELAKKVKENYPQILFHSDAVQGFGKIEINLSDSKIDLLSISSHKIGGLTGTGALLFKKELTLVPLLLGGPQERRARAGTENVLGIYIFGVAAKALRLNFLDRIKKMRAISLEILNALKDSEISIEEISDLKNGLPNTLSIRFVDVPSTELVIASDMKKILVSSGSACHSGIIETSSTLKALGLKSQITTEILRISNNGRLEASEVECFIKSLIDSALLIKSHLSNVQEQVL